MLKNNNNSVQKASINSEGGFERKKESRSHKRKPNSLKDQLSMRNIQNEYLKRANLNLEGEYSTVLGTTFSPSPNPSKFEDWKSQFHVSEMGRSSEKRGQVADVQREIASSSLQINPETFIANYQQNKPRKTSAGTIHEQFPHSQSVVQYSTSKNKISEDFESNPRKTHFDFTNKFNHNIQQIQHKIEIIDKYQLFFNQPSNNSNISKKVSFPISDFCRN
jgi:hypothetical protein